MGDLRFVYGPAGSGKSTAIYTEILSRAEENLKKNYIMMVPDQFCLSTQRRLADLSRTGGTLNIDVLGFGRLSHRIFEEVGLEEMPVLDDMGKCLVLQKVACNLGTEALPVLGRNLHRQGYIQEAKSVISELMQYGYSPDGMSDLFEAAQGHGALTSKLRDVQTLYRAFQDFISGHYITREERLDILVRNIGKSAILSDSVIVFDGFTGFTPIQLRVVRELMKVASEIVIVLTVGAEADLLAPLTGEETEKQGLFYLSRKTASDVLRLAGECGMERASDIVCDGKHLVRKPEFEYLERNLLRFSRTSPYHGDLSKLAIHRLEMSSVYEEVRSIGLEIARLIRNPENKLSYCDIAVLCDDLENYAPIIEREFNRLHIPIFMDCAGAVGLNPLVETVNSAFDILIKNYSADTMFHYIRGGLCSLSMEEADFLEDYCRENGIRGKRAWTEIFTKKTLRGNDLPQEDMNRLNALRARVIEELTPLIEISNATAGEWSMAVYSFLAGLHTEERLKETAEEFAAGLLGTKADETDRLAKEYRQIYGKFMEVLDQINDLLGDVKVGREEYQEIMNAGIGEIRFTRIPSSPDVVVVGDVQRTRTSAVRYLFLIGAVDGVIPKAAEKGGIISEFERELLKEGNLELAPTARESMYTQRFYLYMALAKPSDGLYLSWSSVGVDGKNRRPSYLFETIRNLFQLKPGYEHPENRDILDRIVTKETGLLQLANMLRDYGALMGEDSEQTMSLLALCDALMRSGLEDEVGGLIDAAFKQYVSRNLSKETVQSIWGELLSVSVSQLETLGECARKYFLTYGLRLHGEREYEVDNILRGILLHDCLKEFCNEMQKKQLGWAELTPEFIDETMGEIVRITAAGLASGVYADTERNQYELVKEKRLLVQTITAVREHMLAGKYEVRQSEEIFCEEGTLVTDELETKLKIVGKVDRVDFARTEEGSYVRIIDYKSSQHTIKPVDVLLGLDFQLPLYMGQIIRKIASEDGTAPTASGMLYYTMDNPIVEKDTEVLADGASETIAAEVLEKLRMDGYVLDDFDAIATHDTRLGQTTSKSFVIPVALKNDGSITAKSKVLSEAEMNLMAEYSLVAALCRSLEILSGDISLNPIVKSGEGSNEITSCTYCEFRHACGFDPRLPGCVLGVKPQMSNEEAFAYMQEAIDRFDDGADTSGEDESGQEESGQEKSVQDEASAIGRERKPESILPTDIPSREQIAKRLKKHRGKEATE